MTRTCDTCGEPFKTLSRLRLHDCPNESELAGKALLPEPDPEALPNRILTETDVSELRNDSRISQIENMMDVPLPGDNELISFIFRIDDRSYGLHCDHETAEWSIVAEGEDHQQVKEAHQEWLSDDIEATTGGGPDAGQLGNLDVPETITKDCSMCEGSHELTAQPDSFPASIGMMEYEGFCDETNHPIIITEHLDNFM